MAIRTNTLHGLPAELLLSILERLSPFDVDSVARAWTTGAVHEVASAILRNLPEQRCPILPISIFEIKWLRANLDKTLWKPNCRLITHSQLELTDKRTFTAEGFFAHIVLGDTDSDPYQLTLRDPKQPKRNISTQLLPSPGDPEIAHEIFASGGACWVYINGRTIALHSQKYAVIYGFNSEERCFEERYAEKLSPDTNCYIEAVVISENPYVFVIAHSAGNPSSCLHFWENRYLANFETGTSPVTERSILTNTGSHFVKYHSNEIPVIYSLSETRMSQVLSIPGSIALNHDGTTLVQLHGDWLTTYHWHGRQYQMGQAIPFQPMLNVHTLCLSFIDSLLVIFGESIAEASGNFILVDPTRLKDPPSTYTLMNDEDIGSAKCWRNLLCIYGIEQSSFQIFEVQ